MSRIRAACNTNGPQAGVIVVMTAIHLYQLATLGKPAPLWLWCGTLLFWPALAFTINLIDPIVTRDQ